MVLCVNCKHFRITTFREGDMCDLFNKILSDNLVYDDIPCDGYEQMDSNNSKK